MKHSSLSSGQICRHTGWGRPPQWLGRYLLGRPVTPAAPDAHVDGRDQAGRCLRVASSAGTTGGKEKEEDPEVVPAFL
ncbi:hypothetical protein NL676_002260 [Syzygium grande]|nr:hypothetical protein NL676_002260 [Syzygium grande]